MKTAKKISQQEAEKAMAAYSTATNQITKLDADAKIKIQKIESDLATNKTKHANDALAAQAILENYAKQNPGLFTEKKSVELPGGAIGYRSGASTVEFKDGETEETIVKKMKKWLPLFVKAKYSIIKKDLAKQPETKLNKCGLELKPSSEKFYVDAA